MIDGICWYSLVSEVNFLLSITISTWNIFWSISSSILSKTALTKMPCVRLDILEAGVKLSNCVEIEVS